MKTESYLFIIFIICSFVAGCHVIWSFLLNVEREEIG